MKKLIILTIALVAMFSMSVLATETRVLTMGENGTILVDDANIWQFTGRFFNYPDLAIGEFSSMSSYDFPMFGMHFKFGEQKPWVLGTYFTKEPFNGPQDYRGNSFGNFSQLRSTNDRRVDLFYGRQFSQTNFGFRFGYLQSSVEDDASGSQFKEAWSQYQFDFGITDAAGKWDVAAMLAFGTWDDNTAAGATETEPDGYVDFSAVARYIYEYDPKYTFVPHVGVAFGKHKEVDSLAGEFTDSKLTVLDAGVGMNYTPTRGVLAAFDFGFQYRQVKNDRGTLGEQKWTDSYLPYWKIGMDAEVFNWMDVRLGATSFWANQKTENTVGPVESKIHTAMNNTYLGAGLHWGRLHIDTYTDPQIVLDGFNFISGSNDAEDLNFQVSVLYEMF
ncbi:MAG: hypothetical protein D6800_14570 [Candidatus Zixiibacteriota bacterium]|nr:MAG: hypothetical protein D6800_14570 [candidate division Zixibacteria bacterium]